MRVRTLLLILALAGCGSGDDTPPTSPDAAPQPVDGVARPCISTLAAGHLLPTAYDAAYITYACQGGAQYEHLTIADGVLTGGDARGDVQELAKRTVVLDTGESVESIAMLEARSPFMWLWTDGDGMTIGSHSAFESVALADVDGDHVRDLVVAGAGSIRALASARLPNETWLATGKPFRFVAAVPEDDSKLFYVAADEGSFVELGVAQRISTMPPGYGDTELELEAPATHLADVQPLVVADIDGDGIADICGALPRLFVRSSRYATTKFLDEQAAAVAAGDVTGDGVADLVFVTADRSAVRRVAFGTQSGNLVFASEPLLADGGDAIAVGDLDGDKIADVLLLKDANTMASRVVMHLATSY